MNILFVQSDKNSINTRKPIPWQSYMIAGISYISAMLKKHGHTTDLIVLTGRTPKKVIDREITAFKPRVICFTSSTSEYGFISSTAKYIREKFPGLYHVIGGPHATICPEQAIKDNFDAVCVGEGEYPALELVRQLESGAKPSGIKNLWIKDGDKTEKNPAREFVQDLDALPFPDREMWQRWIEYTESIQLVTVGRGCPYSCGYCCNHVFRKAAPGKYVRLRSPENVLEEIRGVVKRFPWSREITLQMETITVSVEFAVKLSSLLESFNRTLERPLSFDIDVRITKNTDYEVLFGALRKANVTMLDIGLESGSERIRRDVLNRDYSNEEFFTVIRMAQEHGFLINLFIMMGIPTETYSDFMETVSVTRQAQPNQARLSIFYPYHGTTLYKLCEEQGLLETADFSTEHERWRGVLDLPGFPRKRIQREFYLFDYRVFRGHRPLRRLLGEVIFRMVIISRFSWLYRLYRNARITAKRILGREDKIYK